jgi:hypothetical protein
MNPTMPEWEPEAGQCGGGKTADGTRLSGEQAEFAAILGRILAGAWADRHTTTSPNDPAFKPRLGYEI